MVVMVLVLRFFFFLISHIGFHYGNVSKVRNATIFSKSFKYWQIEIFMRYVFNLYDFFFLKKKREKHSLHYTVQCLSISIFSFAILSGRIESLQNRIQNELVHTIVDFLIDACDVYN